MSQELRESVLDDIHTMEFARQAREEFVRGYAETYEHTLRETFDLEQGTDEELLAKTSAQLERLEADCLRTSGWVTRDLEPGTAVADEPLVRLGYVMYVAQSGDRTAPYGMVRHHRVPTESGIALIDTMREAQGLLPVAEHRRLNMETYGNVRSRILGVEK